MAYVDISGNIGHGKPLKTSDVLNNCLNNIEETARGHTLAPKIDYTKLVRSLGQDANYLYPLWLFGGLEGLSQNYFVIVDNGGLSPGVASNAGNHWIVYYSGGGQNFTLPKTQLTNFFAVDGISNQWDFSDFDRPKWTGEPITGSGGGIVSGVFPFIIQAFWQVVTPGLNPILQISIEKTPDGGTAEEVWNSGNLCEYGDTEGWLHENVSLEVMPNDEFRFYVIIDDVAQADILDNAVSILGSPKW